LRYAARSAGGSCLAIRVSNARTVSWARRIMSDSSTYHDDLHDMPIIDCFVNEEPRYTTTCMLKKISMNRILPSMLSAPAAQATKIHVPGRFIGIITCSGRLGFRESQRNTANARLATENVRLNLRWS